MHMHIYLSAANFIGNISWHMKQVLHLKQDFYMLGSYREGELLEISYSFLIFTFLYKIYMQEAVGIASSEQSKNIN